MERCLPTNKVEDSPIVTIGILHRVLGAALDFSARLGVDAGRRALWTDIRTHLPPPAMTIDPGNNNVPVFAEGTFPTNPTNNHDYNGTVDPFGGNSWYVPGL